MTNKGKGIAALVGLGISALAVFGYKRLPQEKKDQIKGKLNEAGQKIKDVAEDVEDSVTEAISTAKDTLSEKAKAVVEKAKDSKKDVEEAVS